MSVAADHPQQLSPSAGPPPLDAKPADLIHARPGLRQDLRAIAELVRTGERVLDLGCGDGTLLRHLIDSRQITGRGVELSEAGILACVNRGLSVRQGDLHEGLGDFPDQSFTTVILSQTLPFLDEPAFVIREMLRVGERAIVTFANWGHWRCRLSLLLTGTVPIAPGLSQPWDSNPRARPLTVRDFVRFTREHGMRIVSETYITRGVTRISLLRNLRARIAIFELA